MHVLPTTPIGALEVFIRYRSFQRCTGCTESEAHDACFKATLRGRYARVSIHERACERFAVRFEMDGEWNLQTAVGDGSVPSSVRRLRPSGSHGQKNHREQL